MSVFTLTNGEESGFEMLVVGIAGIDKAFRIEADGAGHPEEKLKDADFADMLAPAALQRAVEARAQPDAA